MKTKLLTTIATAACLAASQQAHGAICSAVACSAAGNYTPYDYTSACSTKTTACYTGTGVSVGLVSCATCSTGYTLTQQSTTLTGCTGTFTFNSCVSNGGTGGGGESGGTDPDLPVNECPAGCPNTLWNTVTTGYSGRCVSGTLRKSCEFSCASGYYGTVTNSGSLASPNLSGCTQCPSSGGVSARSTIGLNTAKTSCYIPSGSSFSDSTGSGTYTGNCYWKD